MFLTVRSFPYRAHMLLDYGELALNWHMLVMKNNEDWPIMRKVAWCDSIVIGEFRSHLI